MKQEKKRTRVIVIVCITLLGLVITLLIGFGTSQNITEQIQNLTIPVPENTTIPENVTSRENITELTETQPENITDMTAPEITILSPLNTTYNTTFVGLNYTINEPQEWVGYSLNRADNVTILGNTSFTARIGFNELVVYATDSAGNIGKAEVQFTVKLTEPLTITPKLPLKLTKGKDCFALDEEPEFIVEYAGEEEMRGIAAESVTINAFVYGPYGELTDIEIEKLGENNFSVKIPRERAFRAGLYKLSVELVKGGQIYGVEKEFPWGLVSLNTKKSIYKPGETAEFIMVVLDKEGHSVCAADISMTVTNPNDVETVYRTSDGTILPGEECGLYHAEYLTEVEGTHTIDLIALISGIEVNFSTNFSVKQDYEFEIIREAQSKIDPTRQDRFDVTIDIESFTGANSVTIKEFVPAEFNISTYAATMLLEGDTKTIVWNKELIDNKTVVRYSYLVPHIWPYLYVLGPAELDYDRKTFMEARPWYVAVDPVEIRYMRNDTQYVNGLTAYILGTTQSATGLSNLIRQTGEGGGTVDWGIRVWKRNNGSVETEITAGTPVATVTRTADGEGILSNNTWTSPQTSLNVTDAIVVRVYAEFVGTTPVPWTVQANFTTEQLGAKLLDSSTWTVYYYTKYETINTGPKSGRYTNGTFFWGNSTYNSRIENFSWIEGIPPSWYNQSQNVSKLHKGESINLSARWTDSGGLKNATLAHNGTGTWQNVSTIALNGTGAWSNFTLTPGLNWTPGIKGWKIYANDTSGNENVTAVMTFELWGYSNITWISPPAGSSYTGGETITLTCLVRDANTSSPIANYPVHFYNRTDSTITYDFGVNYTNSSGYALMNWATTGVALGWYYPKGNITDNVTLFYNLTAPYEANTSIELISNQPPAVNASNVTVYDNTADVNTENWINFTIQDPNTMNDIKNITVDLWYANSTAYPYKAASNNNRSYYIFKWNDTGDRNWHCALDDAYVNISGHITESMKPSGTKTWQWVNMSFKLNETAVPSGAGTQWNVSVIVYDLGGLSGTALNATSFDVNKYVSAATQEAGINFGIVAPEAQTSTVPTTISFISNTQVEINVTGADLTSGSNSIGYANFKYNATDTTEGGSGSATAFTGSAQVAYADYDAVEDSPKLNIAITGWNYQIIPALAFNGTIPLPQVTGIYTGAWNIGFVAATPA